MVMTEEMKQMLDTIKKYEKDILKHEGKRYFGPDISEKITQKIIKNFDSTVPVNSIVAFFDFSLLGNGGKGLLFTVDGLYVKNIGKPDYIRYKDVLTIEFEKDNYPKLEVGKLYNYIIIHEECKSKGYFRSMMYGLRSIDKEFGQSTTRLSGAVKKHEMPEDMKKKCHAIIHSHATAAGAAGAGLAQFAGSDNAVIVPIQIAMITTMGSQVFELDITEAAAKSIIASAGATIAGRTASQFLVGWIPGIGNAINTATAAGITEMIGWLAAADFYNRYLQNKNTGTMAGIKMGYEVASAEFDAKFRKQAKEFLKQKDNINILAESIGDDENILEALLDGYGKYIEKLENKNASFLEIAELKSELGKLNALKEKMRSLKKNAEKTADNLQTLVDESNRVADVAHNAHETLESLDKEFEKATGLNGQDISFLFLATGLQLARIYVMNELTKIENAGESKLEDFLHEKQEGIMSKFDAEGDTVNRPYHASKNLIISTGGVPYDATATLSEAIVNRREGDKNVENSWSYDYKEFIPTEKLGLFEGANHRFSTLGHDPILGLLFGTANIMTNTITCVKSSVKAGDFIIPIITTNHVLYSDQNKHPMIGTYGSTGIMLSSMVKRTIDQPSALVAALIKQIIHIGTDLFTPCGIQFPGANLVLTNSKVEEITKHISTGDILKAGASMKIAELINYLISAVHQMTYDEEKFGYNRDVFSVKTRKIITYSNIIATGSNVILQGAQMTGGNVAAVKDLDIGGLIVLIKRLATDKEFIRRVKEEFVFGSFNKMIQGEDLDLEEVVWN